MNVLTSIKYRKRRMEVKLLLDGIMFLAYILVCGGLAKSHFSRKSVIRLYGIILGSILLIQSALVLSGQDMTLAAAILPLTAYIPFTIGVFILTGFGLSQTVSIGILGFIVVYSLRILNKIILEYYSTKTSFMYPAADILRIFFLTAAAGMFVFLVFRYLRKPFQRYMESTHAGEWLLLFLPMLTSYFLLSYFSNSVTNTKVLILLLLVVLFLFVMVLRIVFFQSVVVDMKESEQKMEKWMQVQRREYEEMCRKMEAGRIYRHDMRHHLLILNGMAVQEDVKGILNYIENMRGKLAETEREFYCANAAVNTMLSVCIGQARETGSDIGVNVRLPEVLPFDEMDVCMIFANALENAANACKEIAEEKERYIHIAAELIDGRKLLISIQNSCNRILNFGEDGLPVSDDGKNSKEHGIGLKSIRSLVEKYHGFIQCKCGRGEFGFQAVLFREQSKEASVPVSTAGKKKSVWKEGVCITGFSLLFLLIYLVYTPQVSQTMGDGAGGSGVMLETYSRKMEWGDSCIKIEALKLDDAADSGVSSAQRGPADLEETLEEVNQQVEEYIDEIEEYFRYYYIRRNYGYVGCDVAWEVLRDDEAFLSVRMTAVINAGGSGEYVRCFTLDKTSGKVLKLKDLFLEDSDYVGVISEEILRQMTERVKNGEGSYFIPGSIWSEKECFKKISEDQNFYINEENQLVIVFDEYKVAPGSMGTPQFEIDEEVLAEIMAGDYLSDAR